VLGQGGVVLLITDGLDRDDPARLAREAERLHLSCRRLIWLNPLLRWEGFEAKARGVKALLPHVDSFRAAHNIHSLEALAGALTRSGDQGEKARLLAGLRGAWNRYRTCQKHSQAPSLGDMPQAGETHDHHQPQPGRT
jgi:hypothetical protein